MQANNIMVCGSCLASATDAHLCRQDESKQLAPEPVHKAARLSLSCLCSSVVQTFAVLRTCYCPAQVVNGPEVLSKYVGQAEENIRNLFGEAEAEYKEKGDASVRRAHAINKCCMWDQT